MRDRYPFDIAPIAFGYGTAVPGWAEERLSGWPPAELEALGVRLLDAKSLEDLLA